MDNKTYEVNSHDGYDNNTDGSMHDINSKENSSQVSYEESIAGDIDCSSSSSDNTSEHGEETAIPSGKENSNQNNDILVQKIERLFEVNTQIVTDEFSGLQKSFDVKIAKDALQQGHIDRLHQELTEYRAGLVEKSMRPLVRGVIKLHGDIQKMLSEVQELKESDHIVLEKKLLEILNGFSSDVEILLEDNGVAKYEEKSLDFNPRRQRIVRKIATQSEDMHGKISDRLLPGFQKGEEIIEKERVAVYVYRSNQE